MPHPESPRYIGKVEIPHDRIEEPAIDAVSGILNLPLKTVKKIHDFQWKLIKESADNKKTIHVNQFFKISINRKKAFELTKSLYKERTRLINWNLTICGKNVGTRKREVEKKITEIERQIKEFDDLIAGECI